MWWWWWGRGAQGYSKTVMGDTLPSKNCLTGYASYLTFPYNGFLSFIKYSNSYIVLNVFT
jgi:hypothetical protein